MRCLLLLLFVLLASSQAAAQATLREAFAHRFVMGATLGDDHLFGRAVGSLELVKREFAAVSPENVLKWNRLQPRPGDFRFGPADRFVDYAEQNNLRTLAHVFVWHKQTPDWVFARPSGRRRSRDEVLVLLREHIDRVMTRYRGRIDAYDVVNEAIAPDAARAKPDGLRDTEWLRAIGPDYIEQAFRFARAADPGAELLYNDYLFHDPAKRRAILRLVKNLVRRGVPIDGVGVQGHYRLNDPPIEQIEATLDELIAELRPLGLTIRITELDVNVLPRDPTRTQALALRTLDEATTQEQAERYADLFRVFVERSEHLEGVTFWGVGDGRSWLNRLELEGKRRPVVNHPLLFDRKLQRKQPAYDAVIRAARANP
ncbi:MAG: endo-1,4-beta-xylanase [Planctomycetota bacterium]